MNDPFNDHWVDSSVITSRAEAQPGDYFEASIKIADLSMSNAWWFATGNKSEIDVIENIGRPTASGLTHRESEMATNTHYNDPQPTISIGNNAQMYDPNGQPLISRDNFITYGVWWKSPQEIHFYYNDNLLANITPGGPFDEGLRMIFDMEVFHWVGFPTIDSLNDPSRNTMQVDWVRGYRPVGNPGAPTNLLLNPSFEASHPGEPDRPDLWKDCGGNCGSGTPFETRSSEEARSGNFSLRVDNSLPNSFGRWKAVVLRDNVHSVQPGDTIRSEFWVNLTELWDNPDATLDLGVRLNGEVSQMVTGPGRAVLADGTVLAEFADTKNGTRAYNINDILGDHLDEWVKLEFDLLIPEVDGAGNPVQYITAQTFVDNKINSTPTQGIIFFDNFSLTILPELGDFNDDEIVDGRDFLNWQRDPTVGDLADWETNYSASLVAAATIPEPASIVLLISTMVRFACGRSAVRR